MYEAALEQGIITDEMTLQEELSKDITYLLKVKHIHIRLDNSEFEDYHKRLVLAYEKNGFDAAGLLPVRSGSGAGRNHSGTCTAVGMDGTVLFLRFRSGIFPWLCQRKHLRYL